MPQEYPIAAPICLCEPPIIHPNIDLNGKVCMNILGLGWNPVLTINIVILGLINLFADPNPFDPKNIEAAELMRDNKDFFREKI